MYTIGKPRKRIFTNDYRRIDFLKTGRGFRYLTVVGPNDASEEYTGDYSADCPCCYLGNPHSELYHNANVKGVALEKELREG